MKLMIRLCYRGTRYSGYQIQNNALTVQQKLNEAVKALFGSDCDITGCSRTDSGVHADDFCAVITRRGTDSFETKIPTEKIPLALCAHLPEDIAVKEATLVPSDFHPRYDVKYKEYLYKIWNRPERNPFALDLCMHYPHRISEDALDKMNRAALAFCGTHDFISYMSHGGNVSDTVRTVYHAGVERNGDFVEFRISANGFLYNMVRIMAGTLLYVAEGKICPEDINQITEAKNRTAAGFTAPASGLFLHRVVY